MAHTSHPTPHHRALKVAAPVFAGLLLLGACSKKEDTPTATSNSSSTTTAKPGGSSGTGGTGSTGTTSKSGSGTTEAPSGDKIKTDKTTFWTDGFKVTLTDGVIDMEKNKLTFPKSTIENLGPDNATLYGTYSIEAEGTVAYTGNWDESPSVIAKSKATDTLSFSIDEEFDASKSTLVIGSGDEAQVRIPLTKVSDSVLRQPVIQAFKGKITVGQADVDVTQTEVRWDRPDNHSQAEKGKAFLLITGKVKNNSQDSSLYWDTSKMQLARPDGTKTAAKTLLGPGSVDATQIDDKWVLIYDIADPFAGDYTLNITQNFGADNTDVTVTQDLTLSDKSSGSGSSGTSSTTAKTSS